MYFVGSLEIPYEYLSNLEKTVIGQVKLIEYFTGLNRK